MTATINIDLNKAEYMLGVSYKETIGMIIREINELRTVINALQDRVLELEMQAGNEKEMVECEDCGRIFHESENGNIPCYANLCSLCNSEHFDGE